MSDLQELTHLVIGCALRVHTRLGPGLFESVYHSVMRRDLISRGRLVESNKPIGFEFEGHWFEEGFKPDLIIDRCLVVEIKSQKELHPIDQMQLNTYLRILDYRVGLLINFGAVHLRDGIKRIVNNWYPDKSPLPSLPLFPSREKK